MKALLAVLLTFGAITTTHAATQTQLNCVFEGPSGQRRDFPVIIDFERKTVNNFPAQFQEQSITWETIVDNNGEKVKWDWILNRYSGSIRGAVLNEPGIVLAGNCAQAKQLF